MTKIKPFYNNVNNHIFWIGLAILLNTINFFILYFSVEYPEGIFYSDGGDGPDYIEPVENLVTKGTYYMWDNNYAGRMPGIAFVLYPLRLMFPMQFALNLLVLFQVLFSSVAIYLFALLIHKVSKSLTHFYTAFFLLAINSYLWCYNISILTESLALSSFICAIYFFYCYFETQKLRSLLFSGLFFTWCIFLRAYIGILFVPFIFILFHHQQYKLNTNFLLKVFTFLIPFIIIDGIWIIRNYKYYNRVIALQSTPYKGIDPKNVEYLISMAEFHAMLGEDIIVWNPGAMAQWFASDKYIEKYGFKKPNDKIFPEKLFFENYNIDTLKKVRDYIICADDFHKKENTDSIQYEYCKKKANRLLLLYINNYKEKYKWDYYFLSRIKLIKKFIFQPYSYYLPYSFSDANFFYKFYKLFCFILNSVIVYLGLIFSGYYLIKKRNKSDFISVIFCVLLLFIIFYWAAFRGLIEYRYFVFGFLSCIWFVAFISSDFLNKVLNKKNNS